MAQKCIRALSAVLCLFLSCLLLVPVLVSTGTDAFVRSYAAEPELTESGDPETLSVLSIETKVNEVTDEVETTLLLQNTGNAPVSLFKKLPVISTGFRKGSLSLTGSGDLLRTTEDEVFLKIGPSETLTLSYRYLTKTPLIHARVIGMDLRPLVFSESGRIGRFSVSVTLREEDVPLVKEIVPINFTLEETTVSVELWNARPNALLDRFYLEKETYRDLKSEREDAPNEAQQFILDHCRDWFRNGLGVNVRFSDYGSLLKVLRFPGSSVQNDTTSVLQRELLYSGNGVYFQILMYLTMKEGTAPLYGASPLRPLIKEIARQKFYPEDVSVIAVAYTSDPAVRDRLRYSYTSEVTGKPVDNALLSEEAVVATSPSGFRTIAGDPTKSMYRVAEIGMHQSYDAETLTEYLDAIGAKAFVRQMILDDRDGSKNSKDCLYTGTVYSVADRGNLSEEEFAGLLNFPNNESYVFSREDGIVSQLSIPAFTHYTAFVTPDGLNLPLYPGYLGLYYGIEFYDTVVKSEAGQALLQPAEAARQELREKIRAKIGSVPEAALDEVPFREYGEVLLLRVLECVLTVQEKSSLVRTELTIKNEGWEDVLTCLSLPTLENRVRKDSFSVSDAGGGTPVSGGKVYLLIRAGGLATVTYSYRTIESLVNAGAIGMDLQKMNFGTEFRIGHFSAAVELTQESIPLVDAVSPVNYAFDGTTVSVELWNFYPSALLNRFSLSKKTWRNLLGNREYELNEAETAVLKKAKKWIREGLPEDPYEGIDLKNIPYASSFHTVVRHIAFMEKYRNGTLTDEDYMNYIMELPLLSQGLLAEKQDGVPAMIVAVELAQEASLKDVPLYGIQYHEYADEDGIWQFETLYPRVSELPLLRGGLHAPYLYPAMFNVRPAVLTDRGQYSVVELQDYLRAVGASLFIRMKLLDDRDGQYAEYREETPEEYPDAYRNGIVSAPADGPFSSGDLREVFGDDGVIVLDKTESPFGLLGIPAYTQYYGAALEFEDKAVVRTFWFRSGTGGGYSGAYATLPNYNDILSLTSAKRLAAKQAEEQRKCKNNVLKELGKYIE